MVNYKYTNRLINETSPYLLQHAHNPVDWYPWGDEAFQKARADDMPVLLSIGYSACHWCHVMEKESFEDEKIAGLMNRLFVNIKVDREEFPDIDELYQYAMQILGRGGGWPLTVFLTPERQPFFGGTYFPPEERYGQQAFPDVLAAVSDAYKSRKWALESTIEDLTGVLKRITLKSPSGDGLKIAEAESAASSILRDYDPSHGGFGSAPKFPSAIQLSLLLRLYRRNNDSMILEAAEKTLHQMAEGGIYDQLGGGFHRYSVDERWQIPHFEKMLYDNAIISRIYLDVFKITKNPFYRRIAEETLNYLLRDMKHPEGGFFASEDADSEGVEGKFYVWSQDEISACLGEDSDVVIRYFGVTDEGNIEGGNVLHVDRGLKALAHEFDRPDNELLCIIAKGKEKLFAERGVRERPFQDTKVITSWNGLAISAFADAYRTTGLNQYLDVAVRSSDFIISNLWLRDGRLLHVWKDGSAKISGNLDDYAFLASALIDMFEVTFDRKYLQLAEEMTDSMINIFMDHDGGGFFSAAADPDRLFYRLKTGTDQSIPSGNGIAAMNLLRLSLYRDNIRYKALAEETIRLYYNEALSSPFKYASILSSAMFNLACVTEVTVIGNRDSERAKMMLSKIRESYAPEMVIFLIDETNQGEECAPQFSRGKRQETGKVTVYICKDFACSPPLTEPDTLESFL
ncbi:MAG: thioredoxin domain-containing protein [Nitrospirae bacterium]|nr:thioredoxin domain-containing protein [Nitrospirota bacterium]